MKFNNITAEKSSLRAKFIKLRENLSKQKIDSASESLVDTFLQQSIYKNAKSIAAYYPYKGEINPLPIIKDACARGKSCYLPKIYFTRDGVMEFIRYKPGDKLIPNRYGILEPSVIKNSCEKNNSIADTNHSNKEGSVLDLRNLDLLIVPCVAFDKNLYRLGLGGGYYDSIIQQIKTAKLNNKINVIGIAHSMQEVDKLPVEVCDMQVDFIYTEKTITKKITK